VEEVTPGDFSQSNGESGFALSDVDVERAVRSEILRVMPAAEFAELAMWLRRRERLRWGAAVEFLMRDLTELILEDYGLGRQPSPPTS
jgi:hypothetical protein